MWCPGKTERRYTIPYRIDDIVALIQILAYGENSLRTEGWLKKDIGEPRSVSSGKWEDIAKLHPEFFRFSHDSPNPFSLVARYTMRSNPEGKREPLPHEMVKELLSLAVLFHDKEVRRRERWTIWLLPIVVAIIPAFASVVLAVYIPENIEKRDRAIQAKIEEISEDVGIIKIGLINYNDTIEIKQSACK